MSSQDKQLGSDDSFAFMAFTFIVTLMVFAFIPQIFKFLYDLRSPGATAGHLKSLFNYVFWVPKKIMFFVGSPSLATIGLAQLQKQKSFSWRILTPRVLRNCFQFRVILLVLFFFTLSVVTYQKLSFDPHEILGLAKDADEKQIRRAYRKLSMTYHPDKNKTEEAKNIYNSVRRAYKALADPEAFAAEMEKQGSHSRDVSVALPSFLLDPKYRKYAAPLLLGTLFLFPIGLIYILAGTDNEKQVNRIIDRLFWLQDQLQHFYTLMGEPEHNENATQEAVLEEWQNVTVTDSEYEVGRYFVDLCTDEVSKNLNALPQAVLQVKQNKQYLACFQSFYQLHLQKQQFLSQLKAMKDKSKGGEESKAAKKPQGMLHVNIETCNKRIYEVLDKLADAKIIADVPVGFEPMEFDEYYEKPSKKEMKKMRKQQQAQYE